MVCLYRLYREENIESYWRSKTSTTTCTPRYIKFHLQVPIEPSFDYCDTIWNNLSAAEAVCREVKEIVKPDIPGDRELKQQ